MLPSGAPPKNIDVPRDLNKRGKKSDDCCTSFDTIAVGHCPRAKFSKLHQGLLESLSGKVLCLFVQSYEQACKPMHRCIPS